MIDARLVLLFAIFASVAWLVHKRPTMTVPVTVGLAAAAFAYTIMFPVIGGS